ncbi:PorT family protein [Myroides sp. M-43]|uniref:porin family protein n=1 Tax=Myroides oncorhynchi TaxID=2893756 RepID=UPI001E39C37E|nr:porin family protein [Myroides oncorhynchi]MCC9042131.1 PorT family protein [Myroides oncorhynchi]
MKKLLLLLLVITGVSQTYAKEKQRKLNPGVRAGWSISNITNTGGEYRTNFYAGVQLPIRLAKFYELQPELVYSRQGANNATDRYVYPENYRGNTDMTIDYIDINMINKFHFGRINLQVGPGIAINTSSNESNITPVDLTFNFGLGIDITRRLGIEARWMPGIIDINDTGNYSYSGNYYDSSETMRNNTFQIGAYFKF